MCGHGTIGLGVTLAHLGRIGPGTHRIKTPVGIVKIRVHSANQVSIENVASYRFRKDVAVNVEGFGRVMGDIAWGGNWFFITRDRPCELSPGNLNELTAFTWRVRKSLEAAGISGANGQAIDHIELQSEPGEVEADARNFVLCPGGSYDRSPCGTGTSAKLACLHADGKLAEGQVWRQAGILGTIFEGSIAIRDGAVFPQITGNAYIVSQATLLIDAADPFARGIRT